MELVLGIIGGVALLIVVFGTLGLSSLFKRKNNKQKKAELAKARKQVKVYPGHDKDTDELLLTKFEIIAKCINDEKIINLYFKLRDREGCIIEEIRRYDADDIIDYIEIL